MSNKHHFFIILFIWAVFIGLSLYFKLTAKTLDAGIFFQVIIIFMGVIFTAIILTDARRIGTLPFPAFFPYLCALSLGSCMLALSFFNVQVIAPFLVASFILIVPFFFRGRISLWYLPFFLLIGVIFWANYSISHARIIYRLKNLTRSQITHLTFEKNEIKLMINDASAQQTLVDALHSMYSLYPNHDSIQQAWKVTLATSGSDKRMILYLGHGNQQPTWIWIQIDASTFLVPHLSFNQLAQIFKLPSL